jgi:hypothetical protein
MDRHMKMIGAATGCILFAVSNAEAGVIGKLAGAVSGEVVAFVVSAAAALAAGMLGVAFMRVARTFREAGEFLTTLGNALEDRRITREELAAIIHEGKDVFTVWK